MGTNNVYIIIDYDLVEDSFVLKSNATKEGLVNTLDAWLVNQIGQGEDFSPMNEELNYKIKIKLDLTDDSFTTISDTGNKGLTAGIVMNFYDQYKTGKVTWDKGDGDGRT